VISGINLSEIVDYTLPDDKENPTVWKLGVIASGLLAHAGSQGAEAPVDVMMLMLRIGLKGWTNFGDIKFATEKMTLYGMTFDVVPMALIDRLPLNVIVALSQKVVEINHLTPAERKN